MANKNYNRIYNEGKKQATEKPVVKEVKKPEVKKQEAKIGIVCNCNSLNVRKEPSLSSSIICSIEKETEVKVYDSGSTDDFYRVSKSDNEMRFNGYCMKNYIKIEGE